MSKGRRKGREGGIVEGKIIKNKESIINCAKAGYTVEIMSTVTGLTIEEVTKILEELKHDGLL